MAADSTDEPYGWFSPADFRRLVETLNRYPDKTRVVLVGGQALTAWVLYYGLDLPDTRTPYLTQDADFLADRQDAQFLGAELGGTVRAASMDDHTPNAATITFVGANGQKLLIDILASVHGLDREEIRKLAIDFSVANLPPIRVLHPLLCLKSRCENLNGLSSKRTRIGIAQARVAVRVAQCFVEEQLRRDERAALRATKRIADIARSNAGIFVYDRYRINVLAAVDPSKFANTKFREISWPAEVEKAQRKRNVAAARRSRNAPRDRVP